METAPSREPFCCGLPACGLPALATAKGTHDRESWSPCVHVTEGRRMRRSADNVLQTLHSIVIGEPMAGMTTSFNVAETGSGSYRLLSILRWVMVVIFVSFG